MKPPRFRYFDPETADEVVTVLAEHGDEAKVLAGGQSLVPMLSMRLAMPAVLVDLRRVQGLDEISDANGSVAIGALTRQSAAESSSALEAGAPLILKALPHIGHQAIRNRGTFGGSLAHADPAAELPAVMVALDATVTATGPAGERIVPAEELFRMPLVSTLEPDELLTEIRVPRQPPGSGSAVVEIARRHGDFAIAGIAASVLPDGDGRLEEVRLASFGTGPRPLRLRAAEQALAGAEMAEGALAAAAAAGAAETSPSDDIHASAAYRRSVTKVLIERAVTAAAEDAEARAGGGA
jgi:carbon-monoxide dehydrogenase medium subunit